jgi:predicted transposase/invertase (TIGR01784 family)
MDPFLKRLFKRDKLGILDVRVHTATGRIIDVEVQVKPFSTMRERILFYQAKLLAEQLHAGRPYERLRQVINVVLCNYVLLPEEKGYLHSYELRNSESGNLFTELTRIVIIELVKLTEDNGRAEWPWLRLFTCRKREEYEMLAERHPEVRKVVGELKRLSWSERRRLIAESREKWRLDQQAREEDRFSEGLQQGKTEGIKEGIWQGSQEARLETARKMKQAGLPLEQITDFTGLSTEEIDALP